MTNTVHVPTPIEPSFRDLEPVSYEFHPTFIAGNVTREYVGAGDNKRGCFPGNSTCKYLHTPAVSVWCGGVIAYSIS